MRWKQHRIISGWMRAENTRDQVWNCWRYLAEITWQYLCYEERMYLTMLKTAQDILLVSLIIVSCKSKEHIWSCLRLPDIIMGLFISASGKNREHLTMPETAKDTLLRWFITAYGGSKNHVWLCLRLLKTSYWNVSSVTVTTAENISEHAWDCWRDPTETVHQCLWQKQKTCLMMPETAKTPVWDGSSVFGNSREHISDVTEMVQIWHYWDGSSV